MITRRTSNVHETTFNYSSSSYIKASSLTEPFLSDSFNGIVKAEVLEAFTFFLNGVRTNSIYVNDQQNLLDIDLNSLFD